METSKFIEDLYQKVEEQQKQIDALLKKCYLNKKVLTLQEAHEYTGVSTSYLYRLTSTNQIAHFKPSGKLIFFEKRRIGEVAHAESCEDTRGDRARSAQDGVVQKAKVRHHGEFTFTHRLLDARDQEPHLIYRGEDELPT